MYTLYIYIFTILDIELNVSLYWQEWAVASQKNLTKSQKTQISQLHDYYHNILKQVFLIIFLEFWPLWLLQKIYIYLGKVIVVTYRVIINSRIWFGPKCFKQPRPTIPVLPIGFLYCTKKIYKYYSYSYVG